jgi:hypothetical protein
MAFINFKYSTSLELSGCELYKGGDIKYLRNMVNPFVQYSHLVDGRLLFNRDFVLNDFCRKARLFSRMKSGGVNYVFVAPDKFNAARLAGGAKMTDGALVFHDGSTRLFEDGARKLARQFVGGKKLTSVNSLIKFQKLYLSYNTVFVFLPNSVNSEKGLAALGEVCNGPHLCVSSADSDSVGIDFNVVGVHGNDDCAAYIVLLKILLGGAPAADLGRERSRRPGISRRAEVFNHVFGRDSFVYNQAFCYPKNRAERFLSKRIKSCAKKDSALYMGNYFKLRFKIETGLNFAQKLAKNGAQSKR